MNASRDHHTVPRFYLRRFGDGKKRLRVVDKQTGRDSLVGARSLTVVRDFHSIPPGDDEQEDIGSDFVERLLAKFESLSAPAVERLVKNFPPDGRTRTQVSEFVAVQFVRTPQWRGISLDGQKAALTEMLNFMASVAARDGEIARQMYRSTLKEDITEQAAMALFADAAGNIEVDVHPFGHVQQILRVLLGDHDLARLVYDRDFVLVVAAPGTQFVTSDAPVNLLGSPHPQGFIGLGTARDVLIALDPRHALLLRHGIGGDRHIRANRSLVDSLNRAVIGEANRRVFCHPDLPAEYVLRLLDDVQESA